MASQAEVVHISMNDSQGSLGNLITINGDEPELSTLLTKLEGEKRISN
eukprot:gene17914-23250_t